MFDSMEQIIDQLRAGEDGYAEFKEVRLGARSVISPNTEDMAARAGCAGKRGGRCGIPGHRRFGHRTRDTNGACQCSRAVDYQYRNAQLRPPNSTDLAQGIAFGCGRRRSMRTSHRSSARTLRPPNIGRALLYADWLHETRPHTIGTRSAIPAAGSRIHIRRAACAHRHS